MIIIGLPNVFEDMFNHQNHGERRSWTDIYMGVVFSERAHKILKRLTPSNVLSSSVREWATSGGAEHPPLTHVGT